ncbi:MAG: cohesin domain-containing protein [Anaerolineaceae bacterium]
MKSIFSKFLVLLLVVGLLLAVTPRQVQAQTAPVTPYGTWDAPTDLGVAGRPFVLNANGAYHMWYGVSATQLKYVTSTSPTFDISAAQVVSFTGALVPTEYNSVSVLWDGTNFQLVTYGADSKEFAIYPSFDGYNFGEGTKIFTGSTTDFGSDFVQVDTPFLLKDGDNSYKLYFQVKKGVTPNLNYQIWSASSTSLSGTYILNANPAIAATYPARAHHPTVIKDGPTYYMFYTGTNQEGLYMATSLDGIAWTNYPTPLQTGRFSEPTVLKVDGSWHLFYEAGNIKHAIPVTRTLPAPAGRPAVIHDGTYFHMWYGTNSTLYYATSTDGDTFTPVAEVAFTGQVPNEKISVTVVKEADGFYMVAYNADADQKTFALYKSIDGINWVYQEDILTAPADALKIDAPFLLKDGTGYKLYFQVKQDLTGTPYEIFMATADAINGVYTTGATAAIPQVGDVRNFHPTVVKDGTIYYMWFTDNDQNGLYVATSSDGINWTKSQNPLAVPGPNAEPAVLKVNGLWHLYYQGASPSFAIQHITDGGLFLPVHSKLSMSPATMTMDIAGGNQVVEIMATDVENMTAYHMEVLFDHTKLQVVSVENGTLLNSTNTTVVEEDGKDLGNTTGRLKFGSALQAIGGVNYPVTGSGSLVKITFQPIDFGTTSFAIDGTLSRLVDWPDAFFIPYEVTGDADLAIVGFGPAVSFGYVAYDADPNGWLRGVSTDFTIVGANLTDATSLVVKLWGGMGGTTLLQTNTANLDGILFDGFTGFTSPFDIFGNYSDGYWANVLETEYGQTVTPTCVEATATLAGGTVITKKYCADLIPGDRSLLLKGTIEPDGGTGQVPGGTPLTITNVNDTVSYTGLIEWYPAATGRTEGNRVGVEINAPTAFDTTGTTFTFAGTTYNWDAVNDGDNFVWIYPKVTEVPQEWDIVVNWGGDISQTFTVKVLEGSTLNTAPLPTITSTDVEGPYIPGVPQEFTINLSNAGGAYYELVTFDYQIVGVSKADIASFEYYNELGQWIAMGSRAQETYVDCTVGGVASVCGQFGWAPGGFGPFPADFTGNSQFRIKFLNGKVDPLPLTLTLKGKKLGTETEWTVLQTFTANIDVYENVLITGTAPVYYLVGDAGASTITITNPAGGAPYGNHIEFKLTIFGAATTDIASATCDYGIPFDVLSKLSPDGSGNLTGTLIGADGAFEVGAGFDMTIPCTMVFNTAKDYTSTSEMVYVVGADKYVVATNTATAHVYTKPVITSTDLPGSFQQGVAETVTINVDNVDTMYTPNSFVLHLGFPEGTVVVYGDQNVTCDSNGCDILVTLVEGANPLALTVTFNVPSTDDVTVSLVDPAVEPDRTLATYTAANVVHANVALVTGTVTMQGRRTYTYADFTLTGTNIGYGPYHPLTTSNAAGQFSFANIIADTYTVTTNMPRYLNITSGLAKTIALSGNDALNNLWLRAGNATWINGDNIIDGLDASQVGTDWTTLFPVQNLEINCGDVNFDGKVNIQDLALVGGNMDLTSAQAYGTWLP